MDEEIDSDIAEDIDMQEDEHDATQAGSRKGNAIANDPFFAQPTEDQNETVEERKLKMTKQLLQEL